MPSSVRASVVFPLPDSPTRPSVSPGQIAALTSVSAWTSCPRCLKTFDSSLSSTSGRSVARRPAGSSRSAASARGSAGARSWYQQRLSCPPPTVDERRLLRVAALVGERAAIGEDAAGELRAEAREEAGDRVEPAVILADAAARDAAQEADRVRVARILKHRLDRAFLDEPARVEHADARAHLRDDAEVVADEEHRRVELGLQLRDEVEHLGLDRRVEPGRRLVEDEERRILRERHRDDDALLHAAGELVRVAATSPSRGRRSARLPSTLAARVARLALRGAEHGECLRDLRPDPDRRVQRSAGVLVDHRDRTGADSRSSRRPCASTSRPATVIDPRETRPFRAR